MSTHWRESRDPSEIGQPRTDILGPEEIGGHALLMSDGIPDRIHLPMESPICPGEERRVMASNSRPCPHEGCEDSHTTLYLSGGDRLLVVCCPANGFTVLQARAPKGGE